MSFYLVRLQPDASGNMVEVPLPDHDPYEKGSDAAKAAKTLTDIYGYKVQPRRMSQAADWRERQAKRLADGTLKALPAKWDLPPIKDHFAHLDPDRHPGMICFTENDQLGIIDRVTALTPGRYITRFYETEEKMADDRRRTLIAAIDPSGELQFAWTPEEIERVYKEGPSSCMDGTHHFNTPVWPTSVYGAGDLALAYQVNAKGRIQSRCLVWPEKKLYGRIYGDVQRMTRALEADGYETERGEDHSVDGNGGYLVGARLLKVLFDDGKNAVMPYLDDIGCCIDGGDHWITAEYQPDADDAEHPDMCFSGSTEGYTRVKRWCPKMGGYYDKLAFKRVRGAEEEWSQSAMYSYAFFCEETREHWTIEHKVVLDCGSLVCKEWFEANGAVCEATGNNIRKSEVVEFEGKKVSKRYKRRIETERRDEQWRAERAASRERTMRFYDAVSPLLSDSLSISDMVRANDLGRRRDRTYYEDFARLTERQMRDLYMAAPIDPAMQIRAADWADIASRTEVHSVQVEHDPRDNGRYETIHTVDGQTITRRVA
ncbi:hypothetical protein I6F34_01380 [Bradyrhizobium sp. BRP05]|nr:hypothetical protein [Bradyrhizobium sp. BRP05]